MLPVWHDSRRVLIGAPVHGKFAEVTIAVDSPRQRIAPGHGMDLGCLIGVAIGEKLYGNTLGIQIIQVDRHPKM